MSETLRGCNQLDRYLFANSPGVKTARHVLSPLVFLQENRFTVSYLIVTTRCFLMELADNCIGPYDNDTQF